MQSRYQVKCGFLVLMGLSYAACADDDGSTKTAGAAEVDDRNDDNERGDGDGDGDDGSDGDGGALGDGDQGGAGGEDEPPRLGEVDVFTNLPVPVTQTLSTNGVTGLTSAGVRLTSVAWYQRPSKDRYYSQWFGTMINEGNAVLCASNLYIDTVDADGVEDRVAPRVYGITYLAPQLSAGTRRCLGPGEEGAFWTNEFTDTPTEFVSLHARITSVIASHGEAPDPSPPTVTNISVPEESVNTWLEGEVKNGDKTLKDRKLTFFEFNEEGFLFERTEARGLESFDAASLEPEATWSFVVSKVEISRDAEYLMFLDYELAAP